jgi:peptidoglycan/xylan/chitin deacetylase (PgdA/CDA1 family)
MRLSGLPGEVTRRGLAWALNTAVRLSARKVAVTMLYHGIGEAPGDPGRELVPSLARDAFEMHVSFLRSRYRIVEGSRVLAEGLARRRGQRIPAAITFDDDLRSHAEHAAPVLRSLGVPATFFLCGAALERPYAFWWERIQAALDRGICVEDVIGRLPGAQAATTRDVHDLGRRVESLTPEERLAFSTRLTELAGPDPETAGLRTAAVERLVRDGFEIGFHTLRHDPLTGLSDGELDGAMTAGRAQLERLAGRPLEAIAYPHGKADERVHAAAHAAGFSVGFTSSYGTSSRDGNPMSLGRVESFADARGRLALRLARIAARQDLRR